MMRVFIENEAGSTRKNSYDEDTLALQGSVTVSAAYPFPYGFVIGTRSGDGDAVDCFVLSPTPLASGATVDCEPIALLEQIEDGEVDHKIIATLPGGPRAVDPAALAAIKDFIAGVFAHVPGKRMQVGRLLDARAAQEFLARCES